jgi:hypothetical protein
MLRRKIYLALRRFLANHSAWENAPGRFLGSVCPVADDECAKF